MDSKLHFGDPWDLRLSAIGLFSSLGERILTTLNTEDHQHVLRVLGSFSAPSALGRPHFTSSVYVLAVKTLIKKSPQSKVASLVAKVLVPNLVLSATTTW